MGTTIDEQGRPEPPVSGDEVAAVLGFLDYQRATLGWKIRGLDRDALAATTAASSMTLGGLLKHMSYVEDHWFQRVLAGEPTAPPWDTVDWSLDRDWDWHSAIEDTPEQLVASWQAAVERSRAHVAHALAENGLDHRARDMPHGEAPNLRWILLHMIEEYARHNGHADLLRESIDGETGE
jgi:uncharacterized damage-inducible protein DinB